VNNGILDTSTFSTDRSPEVPLQLPECQRYAGAHDPWDSQQNGARNAWDAAWLENSIEIHRESDDSPGDGMMEWPNG